MKTNICKSVWNLVRTLAWHSILCALLWFLCFINKGNVLLLSVLFILDILYLIKIYLCKEGAEEEPQASEEEPQPSEGEPQASEGEPQESEGELQESERELQESKEEPQEYEGDPQGPEVEQQDLTNGQKKCVDTLKKMRFWCTNLLKKPAVERIGLWFIKMLKFPMFLELLNIVVINALLISINNENDKITFAKFELLKTNAVYLVNFIIFINVWESFWKKSFFKYLGENNNHNNYYEEDKKYFELSLKSGEKQLGYFVRGLCFLCSIVIFFEDYNGEMFNSLALSIMIFIVVALVMTFTDTVFYLRLEEIQKDNFWGINVWNYLSYKDEIKERLDKNYLTDKQIFFRNRESVIMKDITNVRKTLKELSDEQLINLIYFKVTPQYLSEFSFSGIKLLKTIKKFIVSVSTIIVGKDVLYKFFTEKSDIFDFFSSITLDWDIVSLSGIVLIIMLFLIIPLFNFLNCTQKKKQVELLLVELISDECSTRKLVEFSTKTTSVDQQQKKFWQIFKLK